MARVGGPSREAEEAVAEMDEPNMLTDIFKIAQGILLKLPIVGAFLATLLGLAFQEEDEALAQVKRVDGEPATPEDLKRASDFLLQDAIVRELRKEVQPEKVDAGGYSGHEYYRIIWQGGETSGYLFTPIPQPTEDPNRGAEISGLITAMAELANRVLVTEDDWVGAIETKWVPASTLTGQNGAAYMEGKATVVDSDQAAAFVIGAAIAEGRRTGWGNSLPRKLMKAAEHWNRTQTPVVLPDVNLARITLRFPPGKSFGDAGRYRALLRSGGTT